MTGMRIRWLVTIPLAAFCWAQPRPLMPTQEALQTCQRITQLIESTAVAVPGLTRASAPVLENIRQALENLRVLPQNSGLTYTLLANARAYLALSDSVPKPYPFPEEAVKQFTELRNAVDRMESHFRALLDQKEAQLRNPDRDNLRRYAEANERLGPPSPDRPRVVFLGDSITDGWRLNEYFGDRDFVNRGISGQVTGEMLGRMQADVVNLQPKAMIVLAGTNDIARGIPLSTIEHNLTMIGDLADFHKIQPLFASVLPISDYHQNENPRFAQSKQRPPIQIRELNSWIRGFCEQRKFVYVDYFSAMVDGSGFLPADMADDGLHPNGKGYRIMAPLALEAIDSVMTKPAQIPAKKRKRFGIM